MRNSRWEEMKYNKELDCWVVFWGDNEGYKVRCGDWFYLHLGEGRKEDFLAGWNSEWIGIL